VFTKKRGRKTMSKIFNFDKGVSDLIRSKIEEKRKLDGIKMRESLEDIALRYDVNYSAVYNMFVYERAKIFVRDYSLLKLFISDKSKYNDKTLDIINRYYRREVSKYV
jgi:hypothetical protein